MSNVSSDSEDATAVFQLLSLENKPFSFKMPENKFRLQASTLCITIPCDDEAGRDAYYDFLCGRFPGAKVACSFELSDSDNPYPHCHASVKNENRDAKGKLMRFNIVNPRLLDFDGKHPNLQKARSFKTWTKYVCKDGNVKANFDVADFMEGNYKGKKRGRKQSRHVSLWAEIYPRLEKGEAPHDIQASLSIDDRAVFAFHLIDKATKYLKFMDRKPLKKRPAKRKIFRTDLLPPSAKRLKTTHLRSRTAFISGPPGIGKTEWVKSQFKNPYLVSHIDQLKKFKPNHHDAIIFDDMDFKHWPRTSKIHLIDQDNDRAINVKHGFAVIPAGTPRVFTSNESAAQVFGEKNWSSNVFDPTPSLDGALARRLEEFNITEDIRYIPGPNDFSEKWCL